MRDDCLLVFARHAQARELLVYGHDELRTLTPAGQRQAGVLARALEKFEAEVIVSSSAIRAQETTEHISAATGLQVVIDGRLQERHLGPLNGLSPAMVAQQYGESFARRLAQGTELVDLPGVEPFQDAVQRVMAALGSAVRGRSRAIVVAHGGPHSWAMMHYLGLGRRSVRMFTLSPGRFSLFHLDASTPVRLSSIIGSNLCDLPPEAEPRDRS